MSNMELWDAVKQPPKWALKQIQGGRLQGMTDVSPQWRYQIMTEQFGPCGKGWHFTVDKLWNEDAGEGQVFAFAQISLYIANDGFSEPIRGIGGSMLVAKESKGLHSSDEGYKMAITDALSTAMKMLGVAADVYAGRWDGSKYKAYPEDPADPPPDDPPPELAATSEQRALLLKLGEDQGLTKEGVAEFIAAIRKGDTLTKAEAVALLANSGEHTVFELKLADYIKQRMGE